jgi:hypothetical protein
MRPVGFGNLFIYLFIYLIHDIVYPYTTRGWKILDYSTCCRKYHSIYDLVVFPGNTSRIIENFQSSSCIIYDYSIHLSFVKNGPKKKTILHICYHGFKKLDRIFPLVEIVSVIPLMIPAIIFNK